MLCKRKDRGADYALVVLPGGRKVDFRKVAQALGWKRATLASLEEAMSATDCVVGVIPPFADSGPVPLVVDPELVQGHGGIAFDMDLLDRSIVLDAGNCVRIAQPLLKSVPIQASQGMN